MLEDLGKKNNDREPSGGNQGFRLPDSLTAEGVPAVVTAANEAYRAKRFEESAMRCLAFLRAPCDCMEASVLATTFAASIYQLQDREQDGTLSKIIGFSQREGIEAWMTKAATVMQLLVNSQLNGALAQGAEADLDTDRAARLHLTAVTLAELVNLGNSFSTHIDRKTVENALFFASHHPGIQPELLETFVDEGKSWLERTKADPVATLNIFRDIAEVQVTLGQTTEAIELLKTSLEPFTNVGEEHREKVSGVLVQLAMLVDEYGPLAEAIPFALRAIELGVNDILVEYHLRKNILGEDVPENPMGFLGKDEVSFNLPAHFPTLGRILVLVSEPGEDLSAWRQKLSQEFDSLAQNDAPLADRANPLIEAALKSISLDRLETDKPFDWVVQGWALLQGSGLLAENLVGVVDASRAFYQIGKLDESKRSECIDALYMMASKLAKSETTEPLLRQVLPALGELVGPEDATRYEEIRAIHSVIVEKYGPPEET